MCCWLVRSVGVAGMIDYRMKSIMLPPLQEGSPVRLAAWPASPYDVNPRRGSLTSGVNGRGTRRRCRVMIDAVACAANPGHYGGPVMRSRVSRYFGIALTTIKRRRTHATYAPDRPQCLSSHTRYAASASHVLSLATYFVQPMGRLLCGKP